MRKGKVLWAPLILLLVSTFVLFLLPSRARARAPTLICMTGQCHPSFMEAPFLHGPIGNRMCPLCHDDGGPPESLPPSHPEVRMAPATEKCLLCHEEISALMSLGSVHTPVADGECVDCHAPHGGSNPFFLNVTPLAKGGERAVTAACKTCHEPESSDWFDEFHASEVILDCVACHNAHGSSESYQLTPYVKSVYLRAAIEDAADLRNRGKLDAAAGKYAKALKVFPGDIGTILLLAATYSSQKEWAKAMAEFEKALSLEPGNEEALVGAADAAGSLDDSRAEMEYLKRALEAVPGRADLHLRIGVIYKERKQFQEAVAEFSKALRTDPEYTPARRQLIEVYETTGMSNNAEEERRILRKLQ